ncbi:RHS repeat domain-containing protein [Pseudomonas protegens]|uniref:RHS repeat domain-containing protein n=1 Tax=Pseudomonas protegens TaxID=380021 RepID=UPI0018160BDD
MHYVFEPGTFVPVAQAVRHAPINLMGQPDYSGEYNLDDDPVWNHQATTLPFDALAWYQCDHLGTPQELTDSQGNMAWTAQYKAWGQYHDHETGLHYNRYRYYGPKIGRFISHDPISYFGGINLYQYASKPVSWIDPLGLNRFKPKTLTTGSVFRGGSGTASSMTPHPNKDDIRKGSNAPGSSADMSVDNMRPGKYVELDVEALCSCGFDVINDKESGHVTIRPSDDPDDSRHGQIPVEQNPITP